MGTYFEVLQLKKPRSLTSPKIQNRKFNYVNPSFNSEKQKLFGGSPLPPSNYLPWQAFAALFITSAGLSYYLINSQNKQNQLEQEKQQAKNKFLYERFRNYASITHDNGQKFLTIGDLFRALLNENSDNLSDQKIQKLVPEIYTFFEDFDESLAFFSFTEYILLTSILISSKTRFKIAFGMLDTDQSQVVTKSEFDTLKQMFRGKIIQPQQQVVNDTTAATFLNLKFFGKQGDKSLTFQNFDQFCRKFQALVFQLEYEILAEKSPDTVGVSKRHFASMILDMSGISDEDQAYRLQNLKSPDANITFEDYKAFKVLLNNLTKFKEIMKFYAVAEVEVKKKEMERASKLATLEEEDVSSEIINLIFTCYDSTPEDGIMDYWVAF